MSDIKRDSDATMGRPTLRTLARAYTLRSGALPKDARIERVVIDVEAQGATETVVIKERDGQLVTSCTSARDPEIYVDAALAWLHGASQSTSTARIRSTSLGGVRMSELAPLDAQRSDAQRLADPSMQRSPHHALAVALSELVTTLTRVGLSHAEAPSSERVRDALVQVLLDEGSLALLRWIGRLNDSIVRVDTVRFARLLWGASKLAQQILGEDAGASGAATAGPLTRMIWPGVQTLQSSDTTLVELGREMLAAHKPNFLEVRYLLDLKNGMIYCECMRVDDGLSGTYGMRASLGPHPRVLHVNLAEVQSDGAFARIQPMQYTISVDIGIEIWERINIHARDHFARVLEDYRANVLLVADLIEPVYCLRAAGVEHDAGFVLVDKEGQKLRLAIEESEEISQTLRALAQTPCVVTGRVVDTPGGVVVHPTTFFYAERDVLRWIRVT